MVRNVLSLIFFVFVAAASAFAQVKLYTEVEPSSGTVADDFVFRIIVEAHSEVPYPLPIGGDDFELTFVGPQTSVEILNGQIASKQIYVYRMNAKKPGKLQAPRAELEIDGKKLLSDPLEVEVKPASADLPKQGGPIFFRQSVAADKIYVGEQIPYYLDIYTQMGLLQPTVEDVVLDGFWQEELGKTEQFRKTFAGEQYQVVRVKKALFPLRSGMLSIPSRTLRALVHSKRSSSRSPFDNLDPFSEEIFDRFFGNFDTKEVKLISNPLNFEVAELPPLPENIRVWDRSSPLVGDTEIELREQQTAGKVGESIEVEVILKSFGNLNLIKEVPLGSDARFKVYAQAPEVHHFEKEGKLRSVKSFKLSLVPLAPGELEIGPLELGFFDPVKGSYEVSRSEPLRLNVTGQALKEPDVPQPPAAPSADPPTIAPTPLLYREPSKLERAGELLSLRLVGFLAIAAAALLALIWGCVRLTVSGRPKRQFTSRVSGSKSLAELREVFLGFLHQRLKLERAALREELFASLAQRYRDANLIFELGTLISSLDKTLYGPGGTADERQLQELKSRILRISSAL